MGQYFPIAFILFAFAIRAWISDYHIALGAGIGFVVLMTVLYFVTGQSRAISPVSYQEIGINRLGGVYRLGFTWGLEFLGSFSPKSDF